jgi:hypothetical protein
MPRVAPPDFCNYAKYLDVSTLHTFEINITLRLLHATHLSRSYWVSSDTGHHGLEASLRSARLQDLLEVGPARLFTAMLGDLGVPTLRSIQDHDLVFFSFWSIKPTMLSASMLGDYSTSASSTPSCFPRRIDLLGNLFLIMSLLDLLFLLFYFFGPSYRPSCPPARILLMSASSMPSEVFHRRFDLLEVCFL